MTFTYSDQDAASNLEADYQQMAQDTTREAEALEWSEAMVGDVADEEREQSRNLAERG